MRETKQKMAKHHGGAAISGIQEKDHLVPMRDGCNIRCRSYTPETEWPGGRAVYMVLHGGGFCLGDLGNVELLCRMLCKNLDIVCVNVEYRLAPEYPFPTAPDDCFDAAKWVRPLPHLRSRTLTDVLKVSTHAPELGVDLTKGFVINGTSAGGNLAVGVCYQWHDHGLQPPITGCHIMNGILVDSEHVPERAQADYKSWWELKNAPILNQRYHNVFIGNYLPNAAERKNPMFSVMRREDGPKILPSTYFQVSGMDPLRDEALIFERWMREAGKLTRLSVYPGLLHGFWSMFPTLSSSKRFFDDALDGARWLLQ